MPEQSRDQAEQSLQQVADEYRSAQESLRVAEQRAEEAVFEAKRAGLSQHDIARIMGEPWNREHNPQFPPVLDLQTPPSTPPTTG